MELRRVCSFPGSFFLEIRKPRETADFRTMVGKNGESTLRSLCFAGSPSSCPAKAAACSPLHPRSPGRLWRSPGICTCPAVMEKVHAYRDLDFTEKGNTRKLKWYKIRIENNSKCSVVSVSHQVCGLLRLCLRPRHKDEMLARDWTEGHLSTRVFCSFEESEQWLFILWIIRTRQFSKKWIAGYVVWCFNLQFAQ